MQAAIEASMTERSIENNEEPQAQEEEAKGLKITIKTLTGETFTYDVEYGDSIE